MCCSLAIGIIIGFRIPINTNSLSFCVPTILSTIFIFIFFKSNRFLPFISLIILFIAFGNLLIKERTLTPNKTNFKSNYKIGDTYKIKIVSSDSTSKEWTKILAKTTQLNHNQNIINCDETILLFIKSINEKIEIGDELLLYSNLHPIKNKGNPGEFDAAYFWKTKEINYIGFATNKEFIKIGNSISFTDKWISISRNYLGTILNKHFNGQELALAQALILGDRSYLDTETTQSFGNSGAMHVLAVSGLHIGILLEIILFVLKFFSNFLSKKKALLIALIIIWIYTVISGLSASVLRSTFMFSVLAIAQISEKNYKPINALFFTGFILLVINPFFLFDIGFQLSFLAMIGIFWFYKPISKSWYIKNKWLRKIWEGTTVGIAAQITTVPLTLFYFHQFPNYFILTNIGLMLSTGLILGFGMFIFGFYWLKFIGKFSVLLLTFVLTFTLYFVQFIDKLPGSTATGFILNWQIVILSYLIIISFYILKESNSKVKMSLIILTFILSSIVIFQRFNQLKCNEICFYNHTKLTFTIKQGNQIYCFYDGDSKDLEKIKFTIKAYQKLYPGNIHYFSMKDRDWKLRTKNLISTIKKFKKGRLISLNNRSYYVKRYENDTTHIQNAKIILMPWLEKGNSTDYLLKNGGIQFSF